MSITPKLRYFSRNDTEITEIMEYGIVFIISNYYFGRHKLINDFSDLYVCVSAYLKLLRWGTRSVPRGFTGFDIINNKLGFSLRIYIDDTELDRLLKIANTDNILMLTAMYGLSVIDLSMQTIISMVLPEVAFNLVFDHFGNNELTKHKEEFLKILSWNIGIA